MFKTGFSAYACAGDTITTEIDGFTITATIHADTDTRTPWEDDCGHGPVSDWTRRDKAPGELVLNSDHGSKRFYDYAEACRIARRDGWGTLAPYRMAETIQASDGTWLASATCQSKGTIHGTGNDINEAIRSLYAAHRATFPSARAYAARAAMADYEVLRAWCNDEWTYCGIDVTVERDGVELVEQYECALWGVELNYPGDNGSYLLDVANEQAAEALHNAKHRWSLA